MSPTPAATEEYPHIRLGSDGVPVIQGTTMKVVELVMAREAHGWSPEELHFQFPHLSMSEIHAALAYYWDHQQAMDDDIRERSAKVLAIQAALGRSPLAERLQRVKAQG